MSSHLLQMRGLKRRVLPRLEDKGVASFTDAWIETSCVNCNAPTEWSHLLQMRGLKPLRTLWKDYMDFMSHLLQMRGLKPVPFKKPVFE